MPELSSDTIEAIKKDLCKSKATGAVRIVILQRGWAAVGRWHQDGDECELRDAAIIRIWGTTKGLGEIADGGPTPKTVLDKCPMLRFHRLTVIATMDCVEAKWASRL